MFLRIFNNTGFSKCVKQSVILHNLIYPPIHQQFFIDKVEINCSPCLVQMIKSFFINEVQLLRFSLAVWLPHAPSFILKGNYSFFPISKPTVLFLLW